MKYEQQDFTVLRLLEQRTPAKTRRVPGKPLLKPGNLLSLHWWDASCATIFTPGGYDFYQLEDLTTSELKAIESFMIKRLREPERTSLAGLNGRERMSYPEGTKVVLQTERLSRQTPARLLHHSTDGHNGHLGDYWLVKFNSGRTQLIPSDMIYRAADYSPAPIF